MIVVADARCVVAPYSALPRDYLSDTPLPYDMGFGVAWCEGIGATCIPLAQFPPLPCKKGMSTIVA